MRRVCVTVATAALTLVAFVAAGLWWLEAPPPDDRREDLIADVTRHTPDAPLVVWIGDSTIRPMGQLTYPELVAGSVLAPAGIESVVRAAPGFTFYQYYCLLGPIVAARPALVVMVLNLRRMRELPPSDPGLCSRLSARAMLGAARLPLTDVGVSLARMVTARLLRRPAARDLRRRMDVAWAKFTVARLRGWNEIGVPESPARGDGAPSAEAFVTQWQRNVTTRRGSTRMLMASVHLARSSGAKALVVVSPAPVPFLVEKHAWDESGYRRVIEEYRAIVADAGGELVDLHDAVTLEGFRGSSAFTPLDSHPNSLGAVQVAARLGPTVAAMLDLPAR
jgi:hypothetical protein